MFEHLSNNL